MDKDKKEVLDEIDKSLNEDGKISASSDRFGPMEIKVHLEIGVQLRQAIETIMETVSEMNSRTWDSDCHWDPGEALKDAFGIDFAEIVGGAAAGGTEQQKNVHVFLDKGREHEPQEDKDRPQEESIPEITVGGRASDAPESK